MGTSKRNLLPGVLLLITGVLIVHIAGSQPVRKKMLDELEINSSGETTTIRISMTTRVRYDRHFPHASGRQLLIRITPFDVGTDDRDALNQREALAPADSRSLLEEVIYEGDIEGGPYLTLLFSHCVEYRVQQGGDFRSIEVYVKESAPECSEPAVTDHGAK